MRFRLLVAACAVALICVTVPPDARAQEPQQLGDPTASTLVYGSGKPFTRAWTFSGQAISGDGCSGDSDEALISLSGWQGQMVVHSTRVGCAVRASGALATTQGWPRFRNQQLEPIANGSYSHGITAGRWIAFETTVGSVKTLCFGWETTGRRLRAAGFICAPPGLAVDPARGEEYARRAGRSTDLPAEVVTPLPTRSLN